MCNLCKNESRANVGLQILKQIMYKQFMLNVFPVVPNFYLIMQNHLLKSVIQTPAYREPNNIIYQTIA